MYVAVKGGETAVKNSRELLARTRRGPLDIPEITSLQIEHQMGLAVDRVMAEGALYDKKAAVQAIKQAQGDMVEAIFLVRAFRTTLKRFGNSKPIDTEKIQVIRRVSGAFKDIPGGQILGPTYDYTHRLINFEGHDDEGRCDSQAPGTKDKASCKAALLKSGTIADDPGEELLTEIQDPSSTPAALFSPKYTHLPWVIDILKKQGLMEEGPEELIGEPLEDLTRQPLKLPAKRSIRLQSLARGDEGFLLGSAYSLQRGFGLDRHPFLGELRVGYVDINYIPPELGFEIRVGRIKITECSMISRFNGAKNRAPGFENGYGLVFGQNERKAMSMSLLDRSLQNSAETGEVKYPAQDQEFILSHSDNVEASGFVQHLKLPHYVDFQSELVSVRHLKQGHPAERKDSVDAHV